MRTTICLGSQELKQKPSPGSEELGTFLSEHLKLEQSQEKTLVTHGRTERAKFLGYDIYTAQLDDQRSRSVGTTAHNRRSTNGAVQLSVPEQVIEDNCKPHMHGGKTVHRTETLEDDDLPIVATFQSEYRGLVNYYALAYNLCRLKKLKWVMEQALTKTLAHKHQTSVKKVYTKYTAQTTTNGRPYKVLKVVREREGKEPLVAMWGGIPLQWNPQATLVDRERRIWNTRTELIQQLLADECEYCGSTEGLEVHHLHRVVSNKEKGTVPIWLQLMRARRRKTMVLCHDCHGDITFGRPMSNTPSGRGFMWTGKMTSTLRKGM